jgi:hypothetical protein
MKNSILNTGTILDKTEQQNIIGGDVGFAEDCRNPSQNPCDPHAGQMFGNPECNLNEVCVLYDNGSGNVYGRCECDH